MKKVLHFVPALLVVVVLVLTSTAVAAQGPATDPTGGQGNKAPQFQSGWVQIANKVIVRRYLEAFEQADVRTLNRLIADNFVNHSAPLPPDKTAFIANDVEFRRSFPAGEFTIQSLMAEGDIVALYGHFVGDHTGIPFLGIPAAGAHASFDFSLLLRLKNGQVTERWGTGDDVNGLLIPLGFRLLPPGQ